MNLLENSNTKMQNQPDTNIVRGILRPVKYNRSVCIRRAINIA